MSQPAFQSIVPYYGGKRLAAGAIVKQLGTHRSYWEPFCGSLAVLFAKPPVSHETVNDLNWDIVNLALCLQDAEIAEDLYASMRRTLHVEAIYEAARDRMKAPADGDAMPDPERAKAYLVASWQGLNGLVGTDNKWVSFALRWTAGGGHQGSRWSRVVEAIPGWHERLRGLTVLCRDGFELLENIGDEAGTVIYCDPPYVRESRGSSERYLFDFEDSLFGDDHARLAELLARFRHARVVVSYYDCDKIRRLYQGWRFVKLNHVKHLANTGSSKPRLGQVSDELLVLNGPPIGE